jgi:hypothetical protein
MRSMVSGWYAEKSAVEALFVSEEAALEPSPEPELSPPETPVEPSEPESEAEKPAIVPEKKGERAE